MALTDIGFQKTPANPMDLTFAAQTGLPALSSVVVLIGHAASGATGVNTIVQVVNTGDVGLATTEANAKFGTGSEAALMVIAAVTAVAAGGTFPSLAVCPLASTDVSIAVAAQTAIQKYPSNFVVTPYDLHSDATDRTILLTMVSTMSGPQRNANQQFGCVGVGATEATTNPAVLFEMDTQYLMGVYNRDSAPAYTVGQVAAAAAAVCAANGVPFNPLSSVVVPGITAPTSMADWITVGAGLESEVILGRGWTPMMVLPNTTVAFVRTVTGRLTVGGLGVTPVTDYYDLQDFQVLYFWRQTLSARFGQPDFKQAKASQAKGQAVKSEAIRLAKTFEDQGMFQAVDLLAKSFVVQTNASDRSRFDFFTPVNVIPGLAVLAGNIQASTLGDIVTI